MIKDTVNLKCYEIKSEEKLPISPVNPYSFELSEEADGLLEHNINNNN